MRVDNRGLRRDFFGNLRAGLAAGAPADASDFVVSAAGFAVAGVSFFSTVFTETDHSRPRHTLEKDKELSLKIGQQTNVSGLSPLR